MEFIDVNHSIISCERVELRSLIVCFLNVHVFVIEKGGVVPGIETDDFTNFMNVIMQIRDSPVSIHCQPAACSAEAPITGVALPEDQYLLRISPEGRRILILGLSAALREIEDWEFSILTSCSKEYVQGLIDVLEAASPKP